MEPGDASAAHEPGPDGLGAMPDSSMLEGLVRGMESLVAERLALLITDRRPAQEKALPVDASAIKKHLREDDLFGVLLTGHDDLSDQMARAFAEKLRRVNAQQTPSESEIHAKFTLDSDDSTFDGQFGDLDEYLEGVTERVGLPAKSIYNSVEIEYLHRSDSHEEFFAPNNGGIFTTPAQEYEYVVRPDLLKDYPGGRRAVSLDVFMLAHGASRKNGGERWDMPLESIAEKFGAEMLDSVKTVLLRKGREAFLSVEPLRRAVQALRDFSGYAAANRARGLRGLLNLGIAGLKKLRKELTRALRDAPRVASTGERSFAQVVARVGRLVPREQLEALVLHARATLLQANLCEEDLIGLRLYTGPSYVKINHSLRTAGSTWPAKASSYSHSVEPSAKRPSRQHSTTGLAEENNYVNTIHCILSGMAALVVDEVEKAGREGRRGARSRSVALTSLNPPH